MIKLKEFLAHYCFRTDWDVKHDRSGNAIVRIYPFEDEGRDDFFEIGVLDSHDHNILSAVIKDNIMNKFVSWFEVNDEGNLSIHLLNRK